MNKQIFLISESNQLVPLNSSEYDSEELLQALLADHPDLLAGDQINPNQPRRWLLISREMGVPDQEAGSGRWSLDHLFLDQDAIPTLIEVKRSSDTRIRREVVGQMLDYAANGVAYWPVEELKKRFEQTHAAEGTDPLDHLTSFIGSEMEADTFWKNVKRNLQAGRIRLLFVADVIPQELKTIIEFLNEQMDPAEVLGVEVQQYGEDNDEFRAIVPRVVGQTTQASIRKGGATKTKRWDKESFFSAFLTSTSPETTTIARQIFDFMVDENCRLAFGKGKTTGSVYFMFDDVHGNNYSFAIWSDGRIEIPFGHLQKQPSFETLDRRLEIVNRINEIDNIHLDNNIDSKFPSFEIKYLTTPEASERFLKTASWVVETIKSHH